jgi:hypothetical protein
MNAPRQARLKLLLIAALFFAPVIGAFTIFFYVPSWIPDSRVNYGTLISPARPVPALALVDAAGVPAPAALRGKWTLVYLGGAACDAGCAAQLVVTRQVRLALAEKRARVQRVYLAPDPAALAAVQATLAPQHADLLFVAETAPRAAAFFGAHDPHAVYLLDPLGNWLMVYAGTIEPKGMHRDLKKLLRASQVG